MPIVTGPTCVVHLMPITSMVGRTQVDIRALQHDFSSFTYKDWGGGSRSLNIDGILIYPGRSPHGGLQPAYTQIFRSGCIETVRHAASMHEPEQKVLPSQTISQFIRDAITKLQEGVMKFGLHGPSIVGVALLTITGYRFAYRVDYDINAPSDRPDLLLPEVWIEHGASEMEREAIIRQLLDILWQAFDVGHCSLYSEEGVWLGAAR